MDLTSNLQLQQFGRVSGDAANGSPDISSYLNLLIELKTDGIITEDEFQTKKSKLANHGKQSLTNSNAIVSVNGGAGTQVVIYVPTPARFSDKFQRLLSSWRIPLNKFGLF